MQAIFSIPRKLPFLQVNIIMRFALFAAPWHMNSAVHNRLPVMSSTSKNYLLDRINQGMMNKIV
jgi:hypothetical protein